MSSPDFLSPDIDPLLSDNPVSGDQSEWLKRTFDTTHSYEQNGLPEQVLKGSDLVAEVPPLTRLNSLLEAPGATRVNLLARHVVGTEIDVQDNSASGEPESPSETASESGRGAEGAHAPRTAAGGSNPPVGPPGDIFIRASEQGDDDGEDADRGAERVPIRSDVTQFISGLGRFVHGPDGVPLPAGEETTIAAELIDTDDSWPDRFDLSTVVGNAARIERVVNGLDVSVDVRVCSERIFPLLDALEKAGRLLPVARLYMLVEPAVVPGGSPDSSPPEAIVDIRAYRNWTATADVQAPAMTSEQGSQVGLLLTRLGFRDVHIPEHGEPLHVVLDWGSQPEGLRGVNAFIRDTLL